MLTPLVSIAELEPGIRLKQHVPAGMGYQWAQVHEGDLDIHASASGLNIAQAFGQGQGEPNPPRINVVRGDLVIRGALDLDDGLHHSMTLFVTGKLVARAVRLDMTSLFVLGDTVVDTAIFFETNVGVLKLVGETRCPLSICEDGEFTLRTEGEVFDSYNQPEEDEEDVSSPWNREPRRTLTVVSARRRLVDEVFDQRGRFNSRHAFELAKSGRQILKR